MQGLEKETKDTGGINIEQVAQYETKPPLEGVSEEEYKEQTGIGKVEEEIKRGKIPLPGSAFKGPIRTIGATLTELTGYPGWGYTEEELNDIATVWEACGIEASPMVAAIVVTVGITGGKAGGYFVWRRAQSTRPAAAK